MRVEQRHPGAYAAALVQLPAGEALKVERNAMLAMSDNLELTATLGPGGPIKALMRKLFGGQDFFMGQYQAEVDGSWIIVAPPMPGDVAVTTVTPQQPVLISQGAFLASQAGLSLDPTYAGIRKVIMREGITMLRASGHGELVFGSYGAIETWQLQEGQSIVLDTGHLVGYTDGMQPEIGLAGGPLASVVSGEMVVARFTGPGTVWAQTRSEQQLRSVLFPSRKQNSRPYRESG